MMVFFCSVGFTASIRTLKKSGKLIFILVGLVAALIAIQDVIGPTCAPISAWT